MTGKALCACLAAGLLAWPAQAQELGLNEILASYYEAVGGLDAWQAVESIKMTGKRSMGRGGDAPFTQLIKRPGKVRTEFSMQGMTGVQAYDGETAWMVMPFRGSDEPQVIEGGRASGLLDSADIDGPLIGHEAEGHQIELVGLADAEGTPAYKLKVTLKRGDELFYYLDAEYFVPIMITRTAAAGMRGGAAGGGEPVVIETIISDYKEVDGLMIAHSIQTRRPGSERGGQYVVYDTVELNVEIDDTVFSLPSPGGGS